MTTLRLLLFGILIIISLISVNGDVYDTIKKIWRKTKSIASSVGSNVKGKADDIKSDGKATLTKAGDILNSVGTDLKTTCSNILTNGQSTLTKTNQILTSVGTNLGRKTSNVLNSVGNDLEGKTLNVLHDTGNILTSIGTNLKGTCNNILNDGEQTLIKTGEILESVGNDLEGETLKVLSDTQIILNSVGDDLQGTTTNAWSDTQKIWNEMENAFDSGINVLTETFGDISNIAADKLAKINKIKQGFNDLASVFGKDDIVIDLSIINPIIDAILIGMIESGVVEMELLNTFSRVIPMVTKGADIVFNELEVFKNVNFDVFPPVGARRRRRLSDLMNENENDASYTNGPVYRDMVALLVQNGGFIDNTISVDEATKLYTDGNVYQQYNRGKAFLVIVREYFETAYDLIDRCMPDDTSPVVGFSMVAGLIALFQTGEWIIDLFMEAADIHDGVLQTTQIEKIFKDQSVIINNIKVNNDDMNELYQSIEAIYDQYTTTSAAVDISPPDAINYNINVIIICSTFIISLLLILLIVFIKGYFNFNRNNQYKYKYKQIDVDTTDSEIDIDHDNKK